MADEFARRRKQFKKVKLRWRVSRDARRSLGWVPFKVSAIRYNAETATSAAELNPLSQISPGFSDPLALYGAFP